MPRGTPNQDDSVEELRVNGPVRRAQLDAPSHDLNELGPGAGLGESLGPE